MSTSAMTPTKARIILVDCGIEANADFHGLPFRKVDKLLEHANRLSYRQRAGASGSRARTFHAWLQRRATNLPPHNTHGGIPYFLTRAGAGAIAAQVDGFVTHGDRGFYVTKPDGQPFFKEAT